MKKALLIILFLVLATSLALAAQVDLAPRAADPTDKNFSTVKNQTNLGIGQELSIEIREKKEETRPGNYSGSLGQLLEVRELSRNLREMRANGISAQTDLNMTVETGQNGKNKLKTTLRNGQEAEIKIMPDTASQIALKKIGLKACLPDNNCTFQLKDVGSGRGEKVQYEMQLDRHSKILGIFQKKMQVRAEVDAETGDAILSRPWWAYISTEQD